MLTTPRCYERRCRHLIGASSQTSEQLQRPICSAFPKGIPEEIAYGDDLHLEPRDGDHGIQYEEQLDTE